MMTLGHILSPNIIYFRYTFYRNIPTFLTPETSLEYSRVSHTNILSTPRHSGLKTPVWLGSRTYVRVPFYVTINTYST